jgi:23S rRNA pseudouridine1911/1915/1917 synthase
MPLVGDPVYGGRQHADRRLPEAARAAVQRFPRQALHALRLGLDHPARGEPVRWEVAMAPDLAELIELLGRERVA